jgi:group I intron endonuclease
MIGIYCIENIINNKKYIGRSIIIERRCKTHISELRGGYHESQYLQKEWNKYGEENFIFYTVKECFSEELYDLEDYYIEFFQTRNVNLGYNKARGGLGTREVHPSQSSIENMRNIAMGNNWHTGFTHSQSTKEIMSNKKQGKKRNISKRTSDYIGVYQPPDYKNKWLARISINGKQQLLGSFSSEVDAALGYDKVSWEYYKDLTKLNFPENIKGEDV